MYIISQMCPRPRSCKWQPRQFSQLIVQIDDLLHADEPVTSEAIATLTTEVQTLLTPDESGNDFAIKYDAALQRNPDVVLAHADVVMMLANTK